MELVDIIKQAQGGNAIANMARAFGISPEQAEAAVKALVPELGRGIERNTLNRGGIADLVEAMGSGRAAHTIQNPAMFGNQAVAEDGIGILKHILGPDKDTSRAAAQRASLSTGLGEGLLKMLLPYIAQLLMGALTKKTEGGLGDILSKIPGMPGNPGGSTGFPMPQAPQPRSAPQRQPAPPAADSPFGNSPLGNGPSANGGGFENQQPLPVPTGLPSESGNGRNPYGDLSDIIRGGRSAGGAAPSGGSLGGVIRDMLGGALGFPGRGGVMSWIFKAIVMRYGWSILRALFGGLLGGRR